MASISEFTPKVGEGLQPQVNKLYGFIHVCCAGRKIPLQEMTEVLGFSHTDSRRVAGMEDTSDKTNFSALDHIYDGQFKIYVELYMKLSLLILEQIKAWQNQSITFWSPPQDL
jgi:hypothetical protein